MKLMKLLETTTPLEGAMNEMLFWFEDIERQMKKEAYDKLILSAEHFRVAVRKYNQLKKKGVK
jgi:hypothetical protein